MSGGNEFVVRVPKISNKKYSVMRFGGGDMMDVQKWTGATMTHDMSAKKIYQEDEVYPEFGAGSEYGRKQKEKARKLKYGLKSSKFNVDDQPWNLSVDTQAKAPYSAKNKNKDATVSVTKEFIGRKEGGIGEGSMYFVFMQTPDRAFEAYPVDSWYNFTRKIKHRTLTDEEAEAEWDKRDKILNHLNYMARKRLKIEQENEGEEDGDKKNKAGKSKKNQKSRLVIHDEVEDKLLMSDSDDSSDEDSTKKKKSKKQKDLKHDAPEVGLEDSDDGDGEGVEQDYNSDVSSEEETTNDVRVAPKGLDELDSSSSSEDDEEAEENDASKKNDKRGSNDEMSSSGDSDIDSDMEKESPALLMTDSKAMSKLKKGTGRNCNSRSGTPVSEVLAKDKGETSGRASPKVTSLLGKRHANSDVDTTAVKRIKSGSLTPTKDLSQPQNQLNEDTIRRCLQHKPITPKDLLKKFKMKKTGLKKDEIVNTVAAILKKLEPEQKRINGKMHLYLKQT